MGHNVISTWLDEDGAQSYETNPKKGPGYAYRDKDEVDDCELLVIDTLEESASGGREVELGMALAKFKRVWRVGPARNIFHTIVQAHFPDWETAYAAF